MVIIVVGGGWAGCAAAISARRAGAQVILLEKTDLLLGTGLVGGIVRNNGRFTAAEEIIALGAPELFKVIDSTARHKDLDFPGHKHASLYDVQRIEAAVSRVLTENGITIKLRALVTNVEVKNNTIISVETNAGEKVSGDVFIDTTGTAGPMKNCIKYGTGCAMCILRCPSFGPRTSLTALAGVHEITAGEGNHHFEAMSGSCKLDKKSLSQKLAGQLGEKGMVVIPLPENLRKKDTLGRKACQQYALEEYAENLILLDTGHAKLMTPYFPMESLREIEGFQEARYADPYSGGQGNSVRFMAIAPCTDDLKVQGIENLFCAGEKTGPLVGHTEAITTGTLAGNNAVRLASGAQTRQLPLELSVGDIISFMHDNMKSEEGLKKKYSFSGSIYFARMIEKGLYITDIEHIQQKVRKLGLTGYFN